MLDTIKIQNFKGFKDTRIAPLRMVNLIIGGQNVGKTSVLEAVYATSTLELQTVGGVFRPSEGSDLRRSMAAFGSPDLYLSVRHTDGRGLIVAARGLDQMRMSDKPSVPIMSADGIQGRSMGPFSGGFPCSAIPVHLPSQLDLVTQFGQVILARKKKELLALLRQVDGRLESLDAIAPDGEQRIYAEIDGVSQSLPLTQMGHGFSRLVHLFSKLLVSDAKLALIDEVENGIHYSALPILFQGIKTVAQERQVQSLITTHSWDCLRAACEVFEDTPELFQVIRLERHGDDIQAVCIDGPRMQRLMAEDREVR